MLRSAGRMPAARPQITVSETAKSSTRQSKCVSRSIVAAPPVNIDSSRSRPQAATSRPSAPPTSDRIIVSQSSCRTTRQRPAPSAVRTANSRSRELARATSRLATLPQVIARSTPTIARTNRRDAEIAAQEGTRRAASHTMRSLFQSRAVIGARALIRVAASR